MLRDDEHTICGSWILIGIWPSLYIPCQLSRRYHTVLYFQDIQRNRHFRAADHPRWHDPVRPHIVCVFAFGLSCRQVNTYVIALSFLHHTSAPGKHQQCLVWWESLFGIQDRCIEIPVRQYHRWLFLRLWLSYECTCPFSLGLRFSLQRHFLSLLLSE